MTITNKRKHRNWRKWYLVITVMAAALVVFVIAWAFRLYRLRKESEARIMEQEYTQAESALFHSEEMEYGGRIYSRNNYVKAILCMGVDRKGNMLESKVFTFGGQADGIFLIAQDTARNTLEILMIPRDTMTEITLTDLNGNVLGKDVQHLTLAYAYGDGREKSCDLMMDAVSGLLGGMKIDHYIAANIEVINILNDGVGGVTVTVPSAGMEKKDAAFVEGATVTLQGEQVESFVRYRDIGETHSAIYRMSRQREYMTKFFDTVKKKASRDSGIVTKLLGQVEEYMVTDMGKEEYLKVAMDALEMEKLAEEDIRVVPGQAVMTEMYDEYHVDQDALRQIVLEMFFREES